MKRFINRDKEYQTSARAQSGILSAMSRKSTLVGNNQVAPEADQSRITPVEQSSRAQTTSPSPTTKDRPQSNSVIFFVRLLNDLEMWQQISAHTECEASILFCKEQQQ